MDEKLRLLVKMLWLVMLLLSKGWRVALNVVGGVMALVRLRVAEELMSARESRNADISERRGWIYMADLR